MVCSSAGVDFMDASLARVDCLVESAPAEEHTALRGLVTNRAAALAGTPEGCSRRLYTHGVVTTRI